MDHGQIEPSRITAARRRKGWAASELARQLRVGRNTVNQWESGIREPQVAVQRLAQVLEVPEAFLFLERIEATSSKAITYRKRSDIRRPVCDRAGFAIDFAHKDLLPMLEDVLRILPANVLPDMGGVEPSLAAKEVRAMWGAKNAPIKNIVTMIEAKGGRVFTTDDPSPSLSAFAKWVDNEAYIILNTAIYDGCRQRFNAAHELGHLLLHREVDFDQADYRTIEREADCFASHLLLSDAFLNEAPPTFHPKSFFDLKPRWGASVGCMVRRLYDAKRFTDWQYQDANIWLSSQGYRSNPEPQAGAFEESALHQAWVDKLTDADLSPRQVIQRRGLPEDTVLQMIPAAKRMQSALESFCGLALG